MSSPASESAMSCAASRLKAPIRCRRRLGGIGQRPQNIEDSAHPEGCAHRCDGFHRRVVVRREQKREVGHSPGSRRPLLVQRQRQAQRFEHVGAARAAGNRAVAMLDHRHAASGRQQRRARRDVEAAGSCRRRCRRCRSRAYRRACAGGAQAGAWRGQSRALRPRRRPCCAARRAARRPAQATHLHPSGA